MEALRTAAAPHVGPVVGSALPRAWCFESDGATYALLEWHLPALDVPSCLTPAEADVARLLGCGLSNAGIAARRGSSERTVANQVASIFRKMGLGSRAAFHAWNAGPHGQSP
jgi:DNA-binding NarL/FixJ family response regulator